MNPFAPQLLHPPKWYCDPEPPLEQFADDWIMEPKLDGWRFVFHLTDDGDVHLYGRRGRYGYTVPAYIIDELVRLFPPDTIVDTELVVPNGHSTDVAIVLADHTRMPLRAYVFDVLRVAGLDVRQWTWSERRALLEASLENQGPTDPVQANIYVDPDLDTFNAWIKLGLEGVVLKRKSSIYKGSRNQDWMKVKPQHTIDLVITGFEEGAGKRAGQMATITYEYKGETSAATVPDWDTARDMFLHPDNYLGRICEIAYHGPTSLGFLRHAIYQRLRPDLES